jgi:hypothetical protein
MALVVMSASWTVPWASAVAEPKKIGIIGLDTSHAVNFTQIINLPKSDEDKKEFGDLRIVAAYPKGSPDIEGSVKRVPEYTEKVKAMGVQIVDSIDDLVSRVDFILLETNDGRPHAQQALPALRARKPMFIDKPIAGSLVDVIRIYEAAEHFKTPIFTSSSLRWTDGAQAIRAGKHGKVNGADAYSPASLEATHPDFFWYGIHGVETLFTVMGPGCQSVSRTSAENFDVATGLWSGGRIGTFRGTRAGKHGYGGTVFTDKEVVQIGPFGGYRPLLVRVAEFFRAGKPPVDAAESIEIYAFMEAADESKRQGGKPVSIQDVMAKAKAAAASSPLR